ncbi:MAG: ribosome biogenesis GTPase Der [Phycisphaeraceae bacterium]|nr:ribosome biogenesis GTPase Der [Phycisphaeraceae bacterium]
MPPKIAIVGRPNVGKSSLLNMLAARRVSIVDPTPGVTRDRISAWADLPGPDAKDPALRVELVDTGGHGIEDVQDLTTEVERQIAQALAEASMVLFIIDAQTGILPLDQAVAQLLRTTLPRPAKGHKPIPVILVANKVDAQSHEPGAAEAARLGFGPPLLVSATSGYHKFELIHAVRQALLDRPDLLAQDHGKSADAGVLLAILGKRNAGKSTLVNALAGQDRVIVSEKPGTTRDSVDVRFEVNGKSITAIDTAGLRKFKSLDGDVEFYSHHRSLRSLRRADVAILLIDATLATSQVDRQIINELLKHHKPTVVVINKWDLVEETHTKDEYLKYLDKELKGLAFAPAAFVSAHKNEGVRDLLAMALNLHQQAGHRITTGELNRMIEQVLADGALPSAKAGKRPKIYYAAQVAVHPPTLGLWVNNPELFDQHWERFFLNRLRDVVPFSEVPIRLITRGRGQSATGPTSGGGGTRASSTGPSPDADIRQLAHELEQLQAEQAEELAADSPDDADTLPDAEDLTEDDLPEDDQQP